MQQAQLVLIQKQIAALQEVVAKLQMRLNLN
jgi:hypothetical protein